MRLTWSLVGLLVVCGSTDARPRYSRARVDTSRSYYSGPTAPTPAPQTRVVVAEQPAVPAPPVLVARETTPVAQPESPGVFQRLLSLHNAERVRRGRQPL